ncbi:hypothetical protein ABGN05_15250 [Aquibium sp. LZ166]|uniref:Lipoprotein n=1 Tax=Aquibium pacificus TaxID=3153579 RepID=A0ABV3SL23_9HYPH
MTIKAARILAPLALTLMVVTGCSQESEEAAPSAPSTFEGDFVINAANVPDGTMNVPEGFTVSEVGDALRLAGSVEKPRPGRKTDGVSFLIPEEFEKQASGKSVTVTVFGSSEDGKEIKVSYSTNGVGNSRWRGLPVGNEVTGPSFTYDVPPAESYDGDYIGILPDPEGTGQTFDLHAIVIDLD